MVYAKYDGSDRLYRDKEELFKITGISIPDPILPPKKLITLKGRLTHFKAIFCRAPVGDGAYMNKEQKQKQKNKLRGGAAAAMLNGNSVAALAGLGRSDGEDRSNYLAAQYFTAKLNNTIELRGWLEFYKFSDGDDVEVVAEQYGDHYEVYAMLKPAEQIICIIPPCKGGRKKELKDFLILFFSFYILFTAALITLTGNFSFENIIGAYSGIGILLGGGGIYAYSNFNATFVLLAEKIFSTLGWENEKDINLRSMTKSHINELIKQNKYSLEWDPLKDTWLRPSRKSSRNAMGLFYYQPEVVFKKKSPAK